MKRLILAASAAATLLTLPASASAAHVCTQGDPPLTVSAHTSCAFAGRIYDAYVSSDCMPGDRCVGRVYSPVTGKRHMVTCLAAATVHCTGANGISVRFIDPMFTF